MLRRMESNIMKITDKQVENWLGSDWSFSEIVLILTELANSDYDQKQLAQDILDTYQEDCQGGVCGYAEVKGGECECFNREQGEV